MKFYDLQPVGGSHYLMEDGKPIARFDDLAKAEAVRESFTGELAAEYERAGPESKRAGRPLPTGTRHESFWGTPKPNTIK